MNAGANTAPTLAVPPQNRIRLYNEERCLPAAEPAIRQNPETPVHILKARGMRRCRTNSCCRRQRLSAISSAFGWTAAASAHRNAIGVPEHRADGRILIIAGRVSQHWDVDRWSRCCACRLRSVQRAAVIEKFADPQDNVATAC